MFLKPSCSLISLELGTSLDIEEIVAVVTRDPVEDTSVWFKFHAHGKTIGVNRHI